MMCPGCKKRLLLTEVKHRVRNKKVVKYCVYCGDIVGN